MHEKVERIDYSEVFVYRGDWERKFWMCLQRKVQDFGEAGGTEGDERNEGEDRPRI